MKEFCKKVCLPLALCLAYVPSVSVGAQGQRAGETIQSSELSRGLDSVQKRLESFNTRLAVIRQHLSGGGVPSQEINDLQRDLDDLKAELDLLGEQVKAQAAAPATIAIYSERRKNLTISLLTGARWLGVGRNSFCVEFTDALTRKRVNAGDIQVDFTLALGRSRLKAIRALAPLTLTEPGRYCGNVNLVTSGDWSAVVRFEGPSDKGKVVFPVPVN